LLHPFGSIELKIRWEFRDCSGNEHLDAGT
jgi:hypothetical protein